MSVASPELARAANDNEVSPANKAQISILLGGYDLNAPGKRIQSIGAFTLGFSYRFFEKYAAILTYNNLMTVNQTLSSIVSGLDVGVTYCFGVCSAMKQRISSAALIVSWSRWGMQLGAGFSQRSVMLTNQSVGFSGPFVKAEANYMLGDRFKVLAGTQYTSMSNDNRALSHITVQMGLGIDFGENVYEASKRPGSSP